MKKIIAFNGSPRRRGNTSHLLQQFITGANEAGAQTEEFIADELQLDHCSGCLRCNMLKRCANKHDQWPQLAEKILEADTLVMASPVYFHHVSAPLKKIIDRFRCFMKVTITDTGLIHTPWHQWKKNWVLLLSLGSPSTKDSDPIVDLFRFMLEVMGPQENKLHTLIGPRLAVLNQITMDQQQLETLYQKLNIPSQLAPQDLTRNQSLLQEAYQLGKKLGSGS